MITFFWLCLLITVLIGSLHIYWGLGGIKFSKGVLPEYKYNYHPQFFKKEPGFFMCLLVALSFYTLAFLMVCNYLEPSNQVKYLLMTGILVFVLRFIGEFNCLGLFKRERDTLFAKMDYYIYMPYCVYMVISLWYQISQ